MGRFVLCVHSLEIPEDQQAKQKVSLPFPLVNASLIPRSIILEADYGWWVLPVWGCGLPYLKDSGLQNHT